MSELKAETIVPQGCTLTLQMYPKGEVDKVIKEKDKEIARLDDLAHAHNLELLRKENLIAELKTKLEDVQATAYAESVDAVMENRRLKRALWLTRVARAHAEWSHWATIWFCDTAIKLNINKSSIIQVPYCCTIKRNAAIWRNMWREVERKCHAKAEEYK